MRFACTIEIVVIITLGFLLLLLFFKKTQGKSRLSNRGKMVDLAVKNVRK